MNGLEPSAMKVWVTFSDSRPAEVLGEGGGNRERILGG